MERLERIKNKWMPDDGFGIGHPIHTDELEKDVRYLVQELEESQELIKKLCNYLGMSADSDHRLWQETRKYCKEKGLLK